MMTGGGPVGGSTIQTEKKLQSIHLYMYIYIYILYMYIYANVLQM